jgi:uncharacterized protein YbjT (DUF2867 family)
MSVANTIAVTGATGFVGRYIVRELVSRGVSVRALVRDRAKADAVFEPGLGVEIVIGDALDGTSLGELVRAADACVNVIGILREAPGGQTFERMHVDVTSALCQACTDAGVDRFVQISSLGVRAEGATAYQRTKWDAELVVRRSGLAWTIFRPGYIHGHDSGMMQELNNVISGEHPPYKFMPYFARAVVDTSVCMGPTRYESATVQPVAVEDVASCVAGAIATDDAIDEIYNLVGPESLTWPQLLEFLRDTLPDASSRMHPVALPGDLIAHAARAAGMLGMGPLLPFDAGMVTMMTEDSTADTGKACAHLGFDPAPFRATVEHYAALV